MKFVIIALLISGCLRTEHHSKEERIYSNLRAGIIVAADFEVKKGKWPSGISDFSKSGMAWTPEKDMGYILVEYEGRQTPLLYEPLPKAEQTLIAFRTGVQTLQGKLERVVFEELVKTLRLDAKDIVEKRLFADFSK